MRLLDMSIADFCDELDSSSFIPGVGSVSALSSSIGIGLARMMSYFNFGNKEYEKLDESIRIKFVEAFNTIGDLRHELEVLIDEDVKSLEEYNMVLKKSKDSYEESEEINADLQDAILFSVDIYTKICKLSLKSLDSIGYIVKYGNHNDVSDLGMAVLMVYTAIEGCVLKGSEKLLKLDNSDIGDSYNEYLNKMLSESDILKKDIMDAIYKKIEIKK